MKGEGVCLKICMDCLVTELELGTGNKGTNERKKENSRAWFGSAILGMVGARKDCGTGHLSHLLSQRNVCVQLLYMGT